MRSVAYGDNKYLDLGQTISYAFLQYITNGAATVFGVYDVPVI